MNPDYAADEYSSLAHYAFKDTDNKNLRITYFKELNPFSDKLEEENEIRFSIHFFNKMVQHAMLSLDFFRLTDDLNDFCYYDRMGLR